MIWIRSFEKIQQWIEKALLFIGGLITLSLMFLITLDVILRKLGSPIPGAFELVQIFTVGIVFLGVAYVQSVKGHIFIEVATDRLPLKVHRVLDFVGYLIGFVICSILAWQTGWSAWKAFVTKEYAMGVVNIPLWPAKLVIAVGMAMLTLRIFWDILYFLFPQLKLKPLEIKHREEESA